MRTTLASGLAAGAAGTTALNVASYLDMVVRDRPASTAPEKVVQALARRLGVDKLGDQESQPRRSALAALGGIGVGLIVGVGTAATRRAGFRPPSALGAVGAGVVAMAAADVPMAVLGITDPRTWRKQDWIADAIPHLAYGAAVEYVLDRRISHRTRCA